MKLSTSLLSTSVKMSIFLTGYYSLESYRPIQWWFPCHQELYLIPNSFKGLTTWRISYESRETWIFAFLPQSSVLSLEEWQCSFCSWSFEVPFSWCLFSLNPCRGCFREQKLYISIHDTWWVWNGCIQGAMSSTSSTSSTSSMSSTLAPCKLTMQCPKIDFELQSWQSKVCLICRPTDLDICVHTKFRVAVHVFSSTPAPHHLFFPIQVNMIVKYSLSPRKVLNGSIHHAEVL